MSSANHKLLTTPEEIAAAKNVDGWMNPDIAYRQWKLIENERIMATMGKAYEVAPYRAFLEAAHYINGRELGETLDILDVGASSGFYGELIRLYGPDWYYTAIDFNPAFKDLAAKFLPRVRFDVGDARDLPYANKTFDVVLAETCAYHPDDWPKVISEIARVASKYVILNRVFLVTDGPTKVYQKTAYDIPVIELWISMKELEDTLKANRLEILKHFSVDPRYPMDTIVCEKK